MPKATPASSCVVGNLKNHVKSGFEVQILDYARQEEIWRSRLWRSDRHIAAGENGGETRGRVESLCRSI